MPEFSMQSVKQMTATIADINSTENFIILKEGMKKILTTGAMIIKVTENARQLATLVDLIKGQKVHMWLDKKSGSKNAFQGLIITQFQGVKALASQPPVVQFSLNSSQGSENAAPIIAVSLSKIFNKDVKISYTVSGTATGGGTDYTLDNGNLVIAAGQTTALVPLIIKNDSTQESDETIVITLTAVNNATLGSQKIHTYTIRDDDTVQVGVGFALASSTGSESATTVNFQVSLGDAATQEVKIDYVVSGTATGGGVDFTLANGTATIPVGRTGISIAAIIVDDAAVESSETLILTLSNPRGATLTSNSVHTYTITDNDQATPTIGFSSAASAGAESVLAVNIPVTLSAISTKETKVNYAVTGTATGSGTDYTLANGTVTIAAGQTTANIALTVVDDTVDEIGETVVLTLSAPVEAGLATIVVHTYTIQDNDNPTIQFSTAAANGAENVTPVSVVLALSPAAVSLMAPPGTSSAASVDVQVTYTVTGTATGGGVDYTLASGTATIVAGQLATSISLPIFDDAIVDPAETIIITISNPINANLGATTVYTYTINDND